MMTYIKYIFIGFLITYYFWNLLDKIVNYLNCAKVKIFPSMKSLNSILLIILILNLY